jgi:2-dehydro-3-deoxyphosphogluconate aldolase/(4S)-4-hydroxy-2-oxoglutarate aldolase
MNLPLIPGVATASEIMAATEEGHRMLKFFPAEAAGGLGLLQAWASPFADVRFCPTGGLTLELARRYLDLPHVPVCGGSWLAPAEALRAGDWPRITLLARETLRVLRPQGQTG